MSKTKLVRRTKSERSKDEPERQLLGGGIKREVR